MKHSIDGVRRVAPGPADSLNLDGLRPPAAAPLRPRSVSEGVASAEQSNCVLPIGPQIASQAAPQAPRQAAPRLAPAERPLVIAPPSAPPRLYNPRRVAPRSAMRQSSRRRAHGAALAAVFLILLGASAWAGTSVHRMIAASHTPGPTVKPTSRLSASTPKPTPTPNATGAVLGAANPSPSSANQAQLQALVNSFAANQPTSFGVVVIDLKNDIFASYQPDFQFQSASLYKLFVADVIYQKIDSGALSYLSDSGYPGRAVDYCLNLMITISDNDCGDSLGDIVGWEKQNQQLQATGFRDTNLKIEPQTSAHDVALLFQLLYLNRLNSPDANQRFLALLKDQKVNNRLPQGLPAGTAMAHKTGDLDGLVHDAGIVYGHKTDYVVAVMSGPWAAPALAPASFVDLSRQLWNFFEQ